MSVTTAVTYHVLPDGEKLARAMAEQMLQAAQEAVASRGVARHRYFRGQYSQAHLRNACRSGGDRV